MKYRRDREAIRTILSQTGGTYFDEIALRGGEGLWPALGEMLNDGEVLVEDEYVESLGQKRRVFRLKSPAV